MATLQEAVNEYILDKKIVSPYDLINDLLPKFYPVSDIVLSAAKYFTTIIKRKDFCVDQEKLGEYGILSKQSNNKIKSCDILQMLKQYNRSEEKDYLRRNVPLQLKSGTKHTIEYKLTPKTFFLCLTRSKNSCEYAEYYFHVLEIYDYYEEYFTSMYKQNIIGLKKEIVENKVELVEKEHENISLLTKMDIMMKKMDEQTKKMIEQTEQLKEQNNEQIKKLNKQSKKMNKQTKKIDTQSEQLTELQITVGKISCKLDSCAHMPDNNELSDRFVVMKSNIDYYVIRAQERNICNAIKRQEDKGYSRIRDLIESETIPNSIYLWNTIKDELVKEKKITTHRNTFKLNIPESDFVTIVKSIFDQRKEYN